MDKFSSAATLYRRSLRKRQNSISRTSSQNRLVVLEQYVVDFPEVILTLGDEVLDDYVKHHAARESEARASASSYNAFSVPNPSARSSPLRSILIQKSIVL